MDSFIKTFPFESHFATYSSLSAEVNSGNSVMSWEFANSTEPNSASSYLNHTSLSVASLPTILVIINPRLLSCAFGTFETPFNET